MSEWLVKGLIPKGHSILLVGQPQNCKSWWVEQLAIDIASGTPHLGEFEVTESFVIFIDEDTPTKTLDSRLDRFAARLSRRVEDLPISKESMQGFRLYDDNHRQRIVRDIKVLRNNGEEVLVILDSLTKVMLGQSLRETLLTCPRQGCRHRL